MNNIKITQMNLDDLDLIAPILETDFDDFWNYSILKSELQNNNSTIIIAKNDENQILGFAGIWLAVDTMHITNIVVSKKHRKQGIGKELLKSLINLTINKNINALTLEVRQDNIPAINLYTSFNFKTVGIRKNYYGDNNAIIMTLYIDKKFKEEFLK